MFINVCQGPSSNPTRRKNGCGLWLRELPEIWGFPFNTSARAKASDFKFDSQLGFAKAHHKITRTEDNVLIETSKQSVLEPDAIR